MEFDLQVRFGTEKDILSYTKLHQKSFQSAYTNDSLGLTADCFSEDIFNSKDTQQYLLSHLVNEFNQKTWLALIEGQLVGSITVVIMTDKEAELTGFYVDPDYQGKGIGKKLYRRAIEFAGARDVVLDIYVHNTRAIEMYKRWGYKLDKSRGENGYFYRHWPEWPEGLKAKCMYMRLKKAERNNL